MHRLILTIWFCLLSFAGWALVANPPPGYVWTYLGPTLGGDWAAPTSLPHSILNYGAVSGLDNAVPIQTAITEACAGNFTLYFPEGDWRTSAMLTIPCSNFTAIGEGPNTIVTYTGIPAVTAVFLVTGSSNIWNDSIKNMTVSSNGNADYAIQTWKVLHSNFEDLRLRNVKLAGIAGSFGVLNTYKNISVSANEQAFTTVPASCMRFFDHGDALGGMYASTITNPICEHVSGDGIIFTTSNDNTIIGGSSEGNTGAGGTTGRGLVFAADTNRNTVIGMDLEVNALEDVLDGGSDNKYINIVSCCVGRFHIASTAQGTEIDGGYLENLTVEANAGSTYALNVHPKQIINSYAFGGGTSVWDFSGPYVEYAPSITCGTGSATGITARGRWRVQGKTVQVGIGILDSVNSTCDTSFVVGLPFVPTSLGTPAVNWICNGADESSLPLPYALIGIMNGTSTVIVLKYDGTFPGASLHKYNINCTYERSTANIVN